MVPALLESADVTIDDAGAGGRVVDENQGPPLVPAVKSGVVATR
ncbi:MAG TPA: hypothetical protein VMR14_21130 [Streptosporangiaceae bacterium]|nr:hypothetical protein [Streptosporangiaceae bacterium]